MHTAFIHQMVYKRIVTHSLTIRQRIRKKFEHQAHQCCGAGRHYMQQRTAINVCYVQENVNTFYRQKRHRPLPLSLSFLLHFIVLFSLSKIGTRFINLKRTKKNKNTQKIYIEMKSGFFFVLGHFTA